MNSRGLQAEVKIIKTSTPSKLTEPNTYPYTIITSSSNLAAALLL
jgi:hypothetical protein